MDTETDLDQVRRHLELLFEGLPGQIEVRTFRPDNTHGPRRFARTIDDALVTVDRAAKAGCNVYVGIATRRSDGSGKKDNLEAVRALWVDADFKTNDDARAFAAELKTFRLAPSMIVWTGGGLHVYWILKDPLAVRSADGIARLEAINRGLLDALRHGRDPGTHNADRILRVPGTQNVLSPKKVREGREPAQARILAEGEGRYALKDFGEYEARGRQLLAEQKKSKKTTAAQNRTKSERAEKAQAQWDGSIPARVDALLVSDSEIAERFARQPGEHADHSNSGIDASLACLIVQRLPDVTAAEVNAALRASHVKGGINDPKYDDRHFERCVELAFNDPEWLCAMNEDYACGWYGTNYAIARVPRDRQSNIEIVKPESLALAYANRKVCTGRDRNGKPTYKTLDKAWLTHPRRRQYRKIGFYPGETPADMLNLWRGFAFEPREGCCDRYLEHLRENICSGDEVLYRWLEAYLAQAIQNPPHRPGTAIVLRGGQGVGKGAAIGHYAALHAPHSIQVTQARHFIGNFNAHLRDKVILWADEAFWAGDKQAEGILKAIVTESTLLLELKGRDAISIPNYLRVFISSNHDWVVPAGIDERRFPVFDVSAAHQQDEEYFERIEKEMRSGGYQALLHHLRHVDISQANLRTIPQTAALWEQKVRTMDPIQRWWLHRLDRGTLPPHGAHFTDKQSSTYEDAWSTWGIKGRGIVLCAELFENYIHHTKKTGLSRRSSETEVGYALRRLVPGLKRRRGFREELVGASEFGGELQRAYVYVFPPLEDCRRHLEGLMHTKIDWVDDRRRHRPGQAVIPLRKAKPVERRKVRQA